MTPRTSPLSNRRLVAFVVLSFLGLAAGLWWLAGPIATLGPRAVFPVRVARPRHARSLPRRGPPVPA
jgi:hypothetical protein